MALQGDRDLTLVQFLMMSCPVRCQMSHGWRAQAWCRERMMALQGNRDLTLVQFLMSCSSVGETAEYVTTYLGKGAEVSQFTSEFLRRKYAEASGKKVRAPGLAPCAGCAEVSRFTSELLRRNYAEASGKKVRAPGTPSGGGVPTRRGARTVSKCLPW